MNTVKTIAILLIVGGALGAALGGFSYTRQTDAVSIGPLKLQVEQQERVNIPVWAGLAAVALGVLLLAASRNNKN